MQLLLNFSREVGLYCMDCLSSPLYRSLASGSSDFSGVGVRWSGFLGFACSGAFYPLPPLWLTELRLSYVLLKTVC